jgi:hypothetical protein
MLPMQNPWLELPAQSPTSLRWIAKLSSGTTNRFTPTRRSSLSPYPNRSSETLNRRRMERFCDNVQNRKPCFADWDAKAFSVFCRGLVIIALFVEGVVNNLESSCISPPPV